MPVTVDAIRGDGAKLQRAESGGAEELHRVENGEDCLAVLHGEAAVFEAEQDAEGFIGGGDFDFFGRGERLRRLRLQEKVEAPVLRKLFLTAQADGRRRGRGIELDVLGQDADRGALGFDLTVQIEEAAVFESHANNGGVSRMQLGLDRSIGGIEFEFILLVSAGQSVGCEFQSGELEAGNLIEAGAFQAAVSIAGVDREAVETGGFGIGVERNPHPRHADRIS